MEEDTMSDEPDATNIENDISSMGGGYVSMGVQN